MKSDARLEYRIVRDHGKFVAIDSGEETVGVYDSEEEARADVARAKREAAMWERSKELLRGAVVTIMAEFGVDRETALYWVNAGSGMAALAMDDQPKHS